ncbi:MAG: VIT1/CCC1 transporter family protein [Flavobacteriales bacterium]|jgi:VIT1/CCC1 family predicted Fe2+/Mn2+ transporter|nr:VIT1/CCC1 transporter family protein [Flavobacteriales bacterium]
MHEEKHFTSSDLIKDIVIGMADGLTVPFALAAGLSGAVHSNDIIITAGVAEIVAGSIAMGLGGYLAGRTDVEHYDSELKREFAEVEVVPEKEKQEVREVLAEYGISPALQHEVAEELSRDKKQWVDFMMKFELNMEKPDALRARKSAFNIGASYIAGGTVPLLGYFVTDTPEQGLLISSIVTVSFLFIFGYVKTKFTGGNPLQGAMKTMLIGVLAAGAAFLIARWIS